MAALSGWWAGWMAVLLVSTAAASVDLLANEMVDQ
jgi:hypothetical protein